MSLRVRSPWVLAFVALPLTALAGPSAEVLYARSNGDLDQNEDPARYSALHVLDGKPETVWCSEGSGQDAILEVQFLKRVSIDKLEVASGHQAGGKFKAYNRPRRLEVTEADMVHPLELRDKPGRQTLEFDPPLSTDRVIFKFKSGYKGENRHLCIADLVFIQGKKPLNGPKLNPIGKGAVDKRPIMDAWVCGPSYSPNRELIFGLGETFRFTYLPAEDSDEAIQKTGAWRVEGGAVQLKEGKEWLPVEVTKDDAGRVEKVSLEAEPFSCSYSRRTPSFFH
ncbi:MAG TPA: hypothetical protein PK668_08000 [Myxococcota bacterium]|nr:hypothetical protein [Myxococcota bacterium]HRY93083.1 hypothetical protein [Myxococcota bacterium]HSA20088.1 hypothetical protein [Myxococcota bacterium]